MVNSIEKLFTVFEKSDAWHPKNGFVSAQTQEIARDIEDSIAYAYSQEEFGQIDAFKLVSPFSRLLLSSKVSAVLGTEILDFYSMMLDLFDEGITNVTPAIRAVCQSTVGLKLEAPEHESSYLVYAKMLHVIEQCVAGALGPLLSDWNVAEAVKLCLNFCKSSGCAATYINFSAQTVLLSITKALVKAHHSTGLQAEQQVPSLSEHQQNRKQSEVGSIASSVLRSTSEGESTAQSGSPMLRSSSVSDFVIVKSPETHDSDPPRSYLCLVDLARKVCALCNPEEHPKRTDRDLGIKLATALLTYGDQSPIFALGEESTLFVDMLQNIRLGAEEGADEAALAPAVSLATILLLSAANSSLPAKPKNDEHVLAFLSIICNQISGEYQRCFLSSLRSLLGDKRLLVDLFTRADAPFFYCGDKGTMPCLTAVYTVLHDTKLKTLVEKLQRPDQPLVKVNNGVCDVAIYSAQNLAQKEPVLDTNWPYFLLSDQQQVFYDTIASLTERKKIRSYIDLLTTTIETAFRISQEGQTRVQSSLRPLLANVFKLKEKISEGVKLFNKKPVKGIKFLEENHLLLTPLEPKNVTTFLLNTPDLDKSQIGEYLAIKTDFNLKVLEEYIRSFNLSLPFVECFRAFIESFKLPGDANLINRIVECFGTLYYEHQRQLESSEQVFANSDACYILAYSIIMLNVDQHNAEIKEKMTPDQFINNLRGTNDKKDFPREMLRSIYDDISSQELLNVTDELTFPLTKRGVENVRLRELKREAFAARQEGLGKSILRHSEATVAEGESGFSQLVQRYAQTPSFLAVFGGRPAYAELVAGGVARELFRDFWEKNFELMWDEFELASSQTAYTSFNSFLELLVEAARALRDCTAINAVATALCLRTRLLPTVTQNESKTFLLKENAFSQKARTRGRAAAQQEFGADVKAQYSLLMLFSLFQNDELLTTALDVIIPMIATLHFIGLVEDYSYRSFAHTPAETRKTAPSQSRSWISSFFSSGDKGQEEQEREDIAHAKTTVKKCDIPEFIAGLVSKGSEDAVRNAFVGVLNTFKLCTSTESEDFCLFGVDIVYRSLLERFDAALFKCATDALKPFITSEPFANVAEKAADNLLGLAFHFARRGEESGAATVLEFVASWLAGLASGARGAALAARVSCVVFSCMNEIVSQSIGKGEPICARFRHGLFDVVKQMVVLEAQRTERLKSVVKLAQLVLAIPLCSEPLEELNYETVAVAFLTKVVVQYGFRDEGGALVDELLQIAKKAFAFAQDAKWIVFMNSLNGTIKLAQLKDAALDLRVISSLQSGLFLAPPEELREKESVVVQLFDQTLFPLFDFLIVLNKSRPRGANHDIDAHSISLLAKAFLHFVGVLSSTDTALALWERLLTVCEKFVAEGNSDAITDATTEAVKNILVVLKQDRQGENEAFTEKTKEHLSRFLPGAVPFI